MTNTIDLPQPPALGLSPADYKAYDTALRQAILTANLGDVVKLPLQTDLIVHFRAEDPALVVLTSDGKEATNDWCSCDPAPDENDLQWFECWTKRGRASRGLCCPDCRGISELS